MVVSNGKSKSATPPPTRPVMIEKANSMLNALNNTDPICNVKR